MKPKARGPFIVLNLDPVEADHACLREIMGPFQWTVTSIPSAEAALEMLRAERIPIVMCESDQRPGLWQKIIEKVTNLPDPPYVIVTSRLADDRLWAEALNLGAYDVLAKPFDRTEVTRILNSAWRRWSERPAVAAAAAAACVA